LARDGILPTLTASVNPQMLLRDKVQRRSDARQRTLLAEQLK
jgi:hypothetical protein